MQPGILELHQLIRGEKSPEALSAYFNADLQRLKLYPGFVRTHVTLFLNRNFRSLKSSFSEDIWKTLCQEYYAAYPATEWQYYKVATHFCEFLETRREIVSPFQFELATFEWKLVEAYFHADSTKATLSSLMINPTLEAMTCQFATDTYVTLSRKRPLAHSEKEHMTEIMNTPHPAPKTLFIFRHPKTHLGQYIEATPQLLFVFKMVFDDISPETAALQSGKSLTEIHGAIRQAIETGIIIPAASE